MQPGGAEDASIRLADTDTDNTTLTSLPAELVQRVCDNIEDSYDILSLRVACKDLFSKVEDSFLDRHMTDRRHLITKYSLETLVKITERPALVRKLRSLTLAVAEKAEEVFYRPYYPDWHPRHSTVKQQDVVCSKWCVECDSLANGKDVRLLAAALHNLKSAGIIISLSLGYPLERRRSSHGDEDVRLTFGWRQLEKDLGIRLPSQSNEHSLFLWSHVDHPTSGAFILKGIAAAQYPVSALTIGDGRYVQVHPRAFTMDPHTLANFRVSLRSLTRLDWTVSPMEYYLRDVNRATLASLGDAMKVATGLKVLKLRFDWDEWHDESDSGFNEPFAHAFQHNLQLTSITFENTMIEPEVFLSFIDHHRLTLEELVLHNVGFDPWPDCTYPRVLRAIATSVPTLNHCQIEIHNKIQADDVLDVEVLDEHWGHYVWDFEGVENVQQKLRLMAESVRYRDD